jgi:hypothetical protein
MKKLKLPKEIWIFIFWFLDYEEWINLRITCQLFYNILSFKLFEEKFELKCNSNSIPWVKNMRELVNRMTIQYGHNLKYKIKDIFVKDNINIINYDLESTIKHIYDKEKGFICKKTGKIISKPTFLKHLLSLKFHFIFKNDLTNEIYVLKSNGVILSKYSKSTYYSINYFCTIEDNKLHSLNIIFEYNGIIRYKKESENNLDSNEEIHICEKLMIKNRCIIYNGIICHYPIKKDCVITFLSYGEISIKFNRGKSIWIYFIDKQVYVLPFILISFIEPIESNCRIIQDYDQNFHLFYKKQRKLIRINSISGYLNLFNGNLVFESDKRLIPFKYN